MHASINDGKQTNLPKSAKCQLVVLTDVVLIDQWTTSVASLNVAVRIAAQHRAGLECFRTCCDRPVDVRLI
jgi:hypothetical protein